VGHSKQLAQSKENLHNRRKIIAVYSLDKGVIYRTYTSLKILKPQRAKNPNYKWVNELNSVQIKKYKWLISTWRNVQCSYS
jgi:hypothetical protein